MIKKLFFLAALLAPGLAYSGNPSADLSVQIVPAGPTTSSQCPNAAPPEAQSAGFTAMVLCEDFTQSIPNSAGTGLTANWNGCGNGAGQLWYIQPTENQVNGGCNDIKQIVDPLNPGQMVLHMQWLKSMWVANGRDKTWMQLDAFDSFTPGAGRYMAWPQANLTQVTYRDNLNTFSDGCAYGNFNAELWSHEAQSGTGVNEFDFFENNTAPQPGICNDMAIHNWNTGGTGSGIDPVNVAPGFTNSYHTFGLLTTVNGSAIESCGYVDHVLQGCFGPANLSAECTAPNPPINQSGCFGQRDYALLWIGILLGPNTQQDLHAWVQSISVWSCPSWNATDPKISNPPTNTCYGALITGENAPSGEIRKLALQ
jgi:hypothetical protein